MKTDKAYHGSGKTFFNRLKKKGESWTALRDKAIKNGKFRLPKPHGGESRGVEPKNDRTPITDVKG